jgi:hypothetical protein
MEKINESFSLIVNISIPLQKPSKLQREVRKVKHRLFSLVLYVMLVPWKPFIHEPIFSCHRLDLIPTLSCP